nr:ribonuclease H-like domain-containing protein [Tanacetum cinerariifolium]
MSLEDLYNHLKVYESEVQKKSKPNSQNMAFISSAKHSRGNEEVNTASVFTASTNVSTTSTNIRVASISQDTACAYIASQSSGSQIKFEDINQIDEDDMEEMDIKWNMALLSMRANRQGSKVEEQAPKALKAIDGVGWDWSYMANDEENHALIADEETPTEFALMAKTSAESEVFDNSLCSKACKKISDSLNKLINKEKEGLDSKLAGFQTASKDLNSLLECQRLDKNKEGLGYSAVPPPPAQVYSPPKKDLSWTGLPEFKDDIVTDYSRPSSAIESTSDDAQNKNPSEASPSTISLKSFIKFVKANDSPTKSKTDKVDTAKKPPVKYAEQYRKPTKKPNVRGNQRNWNNLKSHQLGPNFVMEKKACFNCGEFNHLAYDCSKRVKNGTYRSQNTTHKSFTPRTVIHKPYRPSMRPMRSNMNAAQPNRTSFYKPAHSYTKSLFKEHQ